MPYDGTHLKPEQQALLKAAAIVRERWRQDDYGDDGGPRCAIGAIAEATGREPVLVHRKQRSDASAGRLFRYLKVTDIPIWNDAPGRTAEEVAAAMEAAAMMED